MGATSPADGSGSTEEAVNSAVASAETPEATAAPDAPDTPEAAPAAPGARRGRRFSLTRDTARPEGGG
ncbi:hypothetical protein MHW47_31945, partial [Streptomyces sp. OfavH-34-F]|nr:hypothetical protein [Streptomyces sp. OfavH-34-F]